MQGGGGIRVNHTHSSFNTRYLITNEHFSHVECYVSFQTIIYPMFIV